MGDPTTIGDSVAVRIDGVNDPEDRDELFRRLRRDLELEIDGITTKSQTPPEGAKTDIGIISELVVPFVVASIPVLADKIHTWASTQPTKCTVVVKVPGRPEIHIPNVKKDEVADVAAAWSDAAVSKPKEEA